MIHRQRWTSEKIKKRLELIAPLVYRRQSGIPSFHYFALEGPADPNTADTIFTMQDEEVLWLKAQIDQIGPVIRTKGYGVHVNWGPGGWFTQNEFAGGGAMADMGIHALDTARFLLGDPLPVSVYAQIGTYYRDFDVGDTGVILVNWDNGVTSYIESGWWQPHSEGPEAGTQLYGTQGFASLFPTYLSLPNAFEEWVERVESGFVHPRPEQCPQSMYDAQLACFVDCVRNGRIPNSDALTWEDEIIFAQKQVRSGR